MSVCVAAAAMCWLPRVPDLLFFVGLGFGMESFRLVPSAGNCGMELAECEVGSFFLTGDVLVLVVAEVVVRTVCFGSTWRRAMSRRKRRFSGRLTNLREARSFCSSFSRKASLAE